MSEIPGTSWPGGTFMGWSLVGKTCGVVRLEHQRIVHKVLDSMQSIVKLCQLTHAHSSQLTPLITSNHVKKYLLDSCTGMEGAHQNRTVKHQCQPPILLQCGMVLTRAPLKLARKCLPIFGINHTNQQITQQPTWETQQWFGKAFLNKFFTTTGYGSCEKNCSTRWKQEQMVRNDHSYMVKLPCCVRDQYKCQ